VYRSCKAEDRYGSEYVGTKSYQRLDIKLCVGHERPNIDMGQNTWAPNVIKGWTLNYV